MVTLARLTIHELHEKLVSREISAVELTKEHLERIKSLDETIHAYLTVTEQEALKAAEAVDAKLEANETISPLAGIPMALKDNMCTEGIRTVSYTHLILERKHHIYTQIKIDEINNLGAVKIRLRSLFAAIEQQRKAGVHYD